MAQGDGEGEGRNVHFDMPEDELVAERERGSTLLSEASSRIAQGPWASECDRDG